MKLIIDKLKTHLIAGFFLHEEAQRAKADRLYWRHSSVIDALTHATFIGEIKGDLCDL